MSKNVMRWHPETGESAVFADHSDAPPDWLDKHPDHHKAAAAEQLEEKAPAKPKAEKPVLPMTREEIVAALDEGGVAYKPKASDKALYEVLATTLREHLTAASIEFPLGADAKTLLGLVREPE